MRHHTKPYLLQDLKMKSYLNGYFKDLIMFAEPLIYRTVAGNLVRIIYYNPNNSYIDWKLLEPALSKVFSIYQGPGTSGKVGKEDAVKVVIDPLEIENPLYSSEILAQYILKQTLQGLSPSSINDRLMKLLPSDHVPKIAEKCADDLLVAGYRFRIKGRPRGEVLESFILGYGYQI